MKSFASHFDGLMCGSDWPSTSALMDPKKLGYDHSFAFLFSNHLLMYCGAKYINATTQTLKARSER